MTTEVSAPIGAMADIPNGAGSSLSNAATAATENAAAQQTVPEGMADADGTVWSPHGFQPQYEDLATDLSNTTKPLTRATLTVRIIKSFEYRTMKALVLQDLNLEELTVGGLMDLVREKMKTTPGFKPYKTVQLDTLKIYTVAHGHKTMNLIINLENDDWILDDHSKTLAEIGAENETELSFFNRAAYDAFKVHPETKWE